MDAASQTHGETRTQVDTTGAPQDGITHQDGYRARCAVMSVAYLRRMGDMASSDARPGLAPDKLQRVLAFIEQHLAEPLPIERLAAAVHMSPFPSAFRLRGHFTEVFRRHAGMTPRHFRLQWRLPDHG